MHKGFEVWNEDDSLENVEARIHDSVELHMLRERADSIVRLIRELFPWAMARARVSVVEIGSGLGYIMEAALKQIDPSSIVGLDIAENMIRLAKKRLARDGIVDPRLEFRSYDGTSIPFPDSTYDLVYSVATIQHIPKPYAYNLFGEMHRIIKPGGFAVFQVLSFSHVPIQEKINPFREECLRQIRQEKGHWHFFYSFDELFYVLSNYRVRLLDIKQRDSSLWACFSKGMQRLYASEELPTLTFDERVKAHSAVRQHSEQ